MATSVLKWYCGRLKDTLRYEGCHILLWRILKMCLQPVGYLAYATFYKKDLTKPLVRVTAKGGAVICQATESDIDRLAALVEQRYGPVKRKEWYTKLGIRNTIEQRFRRGHRCFVGKIGGEIVHYNWIFFHWEESIPSTQRFIHLGENEALCNDTFTVEAWRGRAIHTASNSEMCLFLQQGGYKTAYTVGSSNKSAKKTLDRVGWEHSGTILFFIPRGAERAWIFRINGTLSPFVYEQIPANTL